MDFSVSFFLKHFIITMSQFPYFLLLLFFILSSFSMKSDGQGTNSFEKTSPSHDCHGVPIRYPFWLLDNTTSEQFCGYRGFGLTCSKDTKYPIINLPNHSYYVKHIDYSINTFTLFDIDIVDLKCPKVTHNRSVEPLPSSPFDFDLNLIFYFNCTSDFHPPALFPIDCLASGLNKSYAHERALGSEPEGFDGNWYEYCEDKVETAVKNPGNGFSGFITEFCAFNEGFLLHWQRLREWRECEAPDGRCGYNSVRKELFCFSSDGTINKVHTARKANLGLKIGIGFGAAAGAIAFMLLGFLIYNRRNKSGHFKSFVSSISSYPSSTSDCEKGSTYRGVPIFTYNELEKATNNFDSNRELGDGGFGTVYKGELQDGRVVAVKRLYESNFRRAEQFMNEIEILTRLRHPNLVSLYGCTSHQGRQLLLVYEYISNGTIADHLHGEHAKPGRPTWNTRLNIAIETAYALSYLHASDVIHRDVKTTNILLDNNFCVKVADFGLSRLFPCNVSHVSTTPQGTPGYVDPEYRECYQLTDKSDVYSFGVILIELISSKSAVDITRHRHEINLSNMAINKIQNDALHELVDPNLGFESDYEVRIMIIEVAELAFQCLQNERKFRPSMKEVLEALKGIQRKYCYDNKNQMEVHVSADGKSFHRIQ